MEGINVNDRHLQPIEVIAYFVNETDDQYRATNIELVSYFRPLLMKTTSSFGPENHSLLKQITGELAVVKILNGKKYLELKPELRGKDPHTIYSNLKSKNDIDVNDSADNDCKDKDDFNGASNKQHEDKVHNFITRNSDIKEGNENIEEITDVTIANQGEAKHLGNRVRFTEDTARSRAPITLTLQNEFNELLDSDSDNEENCDINICSTSQYIEPAPPLPPHSSPSPPPLPPKPTTKAAVIKKTNERSNEERSSSTGFEPGCYQGETFTTDVDKEMHFMLDDMKESREEDLVSPRADFHQDQIVPDIIVKTVVGSDLEENDDVFPLPDITSSSVLRRSKRVLKKDNPTTTSVKDLTKNFDQIATKQAEQSKRLKSNKEVVGGWRWRNTGGESVSKTSSRSSTSSEDFFTYRTLDERGKRWIFAGKQRIWLLR